MDRCPIELWAQIAGLACTDGGYTGCSLSLVSRTMRDVADPVRYHSISLIGNRGVLLFASRLSALQSPPVIQHLFIAGLQVHRGGDIEVFSAIVHALLFVTAPHLRSLGIHGWHVVDLSGDDLPIFPLLRDITVISRPGRDLVSDVRFPSLRRLHISTDMTHPDFWFMLARLAPCATHLRLSDLSKDSHTPCFLRVLFDLPPPQRDQQMLPVPTFDADDGFAPGSSEATQAVALAARFPRLEHVSVQFAPYDTGKYWSSEAGERTHARMWRSLARIAADSERGMGVGIFVLLPKQCKYSQDEARKDWLDVVEGGDGPWPPAPHGNASAAVRARWTEEGNAYSA